MNILMQACGLLVVMFLFVLYKSHKTLRLPSEKTFFIFLTVVFFSLLLDALSIVAIHYRTSIPEWLLNLSCKSYIISLIWVGWINFVYVSIDLNSSRKRHFRAELILAAVTVVESVIVLFLPISVFEDGMTVYSYGPAVYSVYAFTLFYIVSTLNVAIYIQRKRNSRRGFAVIITTCLWILAAVIQFLDNALLLVGFSEAIGTMILYIVLENPDGNLNKRFGCFNSYAFHEYITMRLDGGKNFGLLDLSITDIKALEGRGIEIDAAANKVIQNLSSYRELLVFINDLANLIVVSDDEAILNRVASELVELIGAYSISSNDVAVFTLGNAKDFRNSEELLRFLTYVRGTKSARLSAFVHVSDEMIANYRNIEVVEEEITKALTEDRIEVFLQPIYSNAEKKIISAEALARIRKQDGTLMSPGLFIPVAERTGQIKAIGERVLEKACEFLKYSKAVELGIRCIDVNLSVVQCDDNMMASNLCRIVDQYGIDSSLISFEITETAVSTAKDTLIENMNVLVAKGFSFALDDFGKGESNLIYIVEMPVKFIKLDIDMSKAYFSNQKAKEVISAITDMAKNLGLPIVAEGIESKNEADGILSAGVQFIQGYYYSRPLPMKEFIEYLEDNSFKRPTDETDLQDMLVPIFAQTDDPDTSALEGQRVLLVEDNELNREIAKELLEEFDLVVDTAEDGTVAVEKMKHAVAGDYDFILMDIRMPLMDGFEATRQIRNLKNKEAASIPIIALTAYDDEENRKTAKAVGIDGIAPKPINVPQIVDIIARLEHSFGRI